jgi:DMSO/TMAO reductase YedYZ molybdopterin-dependent catalytic subunit
VVGLRNRKRGLTDDELRRIPPGQHFVRDFPVLHAGSVPRTDPTTWHMRVWGLVANELRWDYGEFRALPTTAQVCDIHCVTTWSKLDTTWEGLPMAWVLEQAKPLPTATHVIAHAEEGYTTNLPIAAIRDDDVMLAYRYDGAELDPEHGGPLRLLVPKLYFWKSAKWLRGLQFVDRDQPGYWERLGYSNGADPWKEERYAF